MKILLELRPALDGHAGIPQEVRLLFRGLGLLDGVEVDGLLQSSNRLLAKGLPASEDVLNRWSEDKRVDRLSRVVVSMLPRSGRGRVWRVSELLLLGWASVKLVANAAIGRRAQLTRFVPTRFSDFVWRALFAKTLPSEDIGSMTSARYRIARVPWSAAHAGGLFTRRLGAAIYPRLDTRGYEFMIAETPYPGRVVSPTQMIVRYHDAFPLLMPHTITDRARHQASHYQALRRNVRDGAWFACVSETTRKDLVSVFPEVEPRAVTIPNMVSHRYFVEESSPSMVRQVLRTRANQRIRALAKRRGYPKLAGGNDKDQPSDPEYLLMVSTLEPRKNHLGLLAAWEQLRANGRPNLRLVLVGMLGWDHKGIVGKLLPWVAQGLVHVLDDVPAAELRVLYRHAGATVCASFGEGFGFSGVEAMCCGGVVAASDLPVHRDVYADAAVYFNPYSAGDIAGSLERLLSGDDECLQLRKRLVEEGATVSSRYTPDEVLPLWHALLDSLSGRAAKQAAINQ
ncbi:MAG: glycosyltransferase family 4 protein [Burkholderiales bacterium]|jgi:glycosyltransferase involved in cell wall biosynthesis|nr:glycosyltransferase family 4 protein [Burkholderiales bacterium]